MITQNTDQNALTVAIGSSHYNDELLIACISSPVINGMAYNSVIGSSLALDCSVIEVNRLTTLLVCFTLSD
ncbi:hypothetical protein J6590_080661 [Homalodisca vitripennis]|nr:hypothetical protein J6590_080661 [Homalodisca vitripennis]